MRRRVSRSRCDQPRDTRQGRSDDAVKAHGEEHGRKHAQYMRSPVRILASGSLL
jgi:hypothetical protein